MKRIATVLLAIILLTVCAGGVAATGGSAADPLVSISYIESTFKPQIMELASVSIEGTVGKLYSGMLKRLDEISLPGGAGYSYSPQYKDIAFSFGGTLTMGEFASFVPLSGTMTITIEAGEVLNLSTGESIKSGSVLKTGNRYFSAENSSSLIRVFSDSASALADGYYKHAVSGTIPYNTVFIDISENWAENDIIALAAKGYVNGTGNYMFSPDMTLTRAMFVTILGRVSRVDTSMYTSVTFKDVRMDTWYGPYVAWAASGGIVNGYDADRFGPNDNITREQMAKIIISYADYMGAILDQSQNSQPFADEAQVSPWAEEYVRRARAAGLISGEQTDAAVFGPRKEADRAQVCSVINRYIIKTGLG